MRNKIKEGVENYLKSLETLVYGTYPPATRWLMDKPYRERMFEENPECFLTIRKLNGSELPFFPICNRLVINNKEIVKRAIELANSLKNDRRVDQNSLDQTIIKLTVISNQ